MSALLLTGPVGVGKTTVAEAVGELLAAAEVPHAVIDLDWLAQYWPSPPDDRFNLTLQLRNLHAVARNYLDAGAEHLVLAGVVESRDDRDRYAEALGTDLTVCRLTADLTVIQQRLIRRHLSEEDLRWHLHRAPELTEIFDRAQVDDFAIAADRPVLDVARDVLTATGWC